MTGQAREEEERITIDDFIKQNTVSESDIVEAGNYTPILSTKAATVETCRPAKNSSIDQRATYRKNAL